MKRLDARLGEGKTSAIGLASSSQVMLGAFSDEAIAKAEIEGERR